MIYTYIIPTKRFHINTWDEVILLITILQKHCNNNDLVNSQITFTLFLRLHFIHTALHLFSEFYKINAEKNIGKIRLYTKSFPMLYERAYLNYSDRKLAFSTI